VAGRFRFSVRRANSQQRRAVPNPIPRQKVRSQEIQMDGLTLFGLVAVTLMLVLYALEKRSRWFILAFSGSCVLASVYGFLQGAWPFGLVEAVWSVVALRRWWLERHAAR
jgi:hypothetical protein